jgi:hypothetical protein
MEKRVLQNNFPFFKIATIVAGLESFDIGFFDASLKYVVVLCPYQFQIESLGASG